MRLLIVVAIAVLLAACTESGDGAKSGEKAKRPIGMSEEIWKIYGGAESGVTDDTKDKPQEKK
jgi:hypothetical protein